jgi:O-antigen ligase
MTFSKILSRIIYGLLLLTTATPLIYQKKLFFPYDSEKGLFFRFLSEIILGLWLILIVQDSSFRPRRTPITLALLGFTAVLILVDMLGINPYLSIFSNFERMAGLIMYLSVISYCFVISSIINSSKRWFVFGISLSVIAFIVSVKAIIQTYNAEDILINSGRAVGTVGNANQLASYLLLGFFVVGLLVNQWILPMRKSKPVFSILLLIISTIFLITYTFCFIKTSARGSLIGLILGVGFMLILSIIQSKQRRLKQISVGILGGLFIIMAGLFYVRETSFIKENAVLYRITHITGYNGINTLSSRLNNYKVAIDGIKAKPFLGWGQETYHYTYAQYFNPKMYNDAAWYDRVHNVILEWLINGGVIGLLIYLVLWGAVLFQLWKKDNRLNINTKIIILGFLMAYFIGNLSLFDNLLSLMAFMIVIGFVNFPAPWSVSPPTTSLAPWSLSPTSNFAITVFIIISTFFTLKFTCLNAYQTNQEIVKAYNAGSLEEVIETYAQAYPKAIIGKQEIAEQLANLANDVANNQVPEATKKRYFEIANDVISSEIKAHPDYARLQILYGNMLEAQKNNTEAITIYEKVQTLAPKRQSNLIQLAILYAKNKEFGKAQKLLRKTYLLEPKNEEPRVYQAIVYALNNQVEQRNTIINELTDDAFGRHYNLIKYCFSLTNDMKGFLDTFRHKSDSDYEDYYKEWANIAYSFKNYSEVETAIIMYRYKFSGFKFRVPNDYDLLRRRIQQGENPSFVFEKIE